MNEDLIGYIEQSIKTHWDHPALSDYGGRSLSYAEVARYIGDLHGLFRECSVEPGDHIAVTGRNCVNLALVYLAALTFGAVIVPILPDFPAENIEHIVNHSHSLLLFCPQRRFDELDEGLTPELSAVFSLEDFTFLFGRRKRLRERVRRAWAEAGNPKFAAEEVSYVRPDMDQLMALVYTSGTSGFSKGVMLPHRSLVSNLVYAHDNMTLRVGDRILSFLPLVHTFSNMFELLFPFTLGCHITFLTRRPTPKLLQKAFSEVRPRMVYLVPLILEKIYRKQIRPMLKRPWSRAVLAAPVLREVFYRKIRDRLIEFFGGKFEEVVVGGASLNPEVEDFLFRIGFPFTVGYGMTECGPLISYEYYRTTRPRSVGRKVDRVELEIASENPQAQIGEILVRGDHVMVGYYQNPEATSKAIDAEGWLHTGDLGIVDPAGFLYIKGRSKNVIVGPSGENIYPEEIEAQVNILPYVQESLVVEKADSLFLLVHPDMEAVERAGMQEADLERAMEANVEAINRKLPAHVHLSGFKVYPEEFEKTPTQKIKRYLHTLE